MPSAPAAPGSVLNVHDLRAGTPERDIVRGVSLEIRHGEIHAVMGPNGSGKSTLVSVLAGHPSYVTTGGTAVFRDADLLALEAHERARAGLFLAFQYPREIAGVTLRGFLLAASNAQREARGEKRISPMQFDRVLKQEMAALALDAAFADRGVHQGFSGGEKKKLEILQLLVLQPALALLDETDSGLDVDALKTVAQGVRRERERNPSFAAVVVTHYARILEHLRPDRVHVMVRGAIVESGGPDLAHRLEREGYARFAGESIPLDAA